MISDLLKDLFTMRKVQKEIAHQGRTLDMLIHDLRTSPYSHSKWFKPEKIAILKQVTTAITAQQNLLHAMQVKIDVEIKNLR